MADVDLTVQMDPSPALSGAHKIETGTKAAMRGVSAGIKATARDYAILEKAIAQSEARAERAARTAARQSSKSGNRVSYAIGGAAMQLQDVAVQLEGGASAARVIGQQGSQMASAFGPGGMILGAVVAIGAGLWNVVRGTKEATKEAKDLADSWKKVQEQVGKIDETVKSSNTRVQEMRDQERVGSGRMTDTEAEIRKIDREFTEKRRQFAKDNAELIKFSEQSVKVPTERLNIQERKFPAMGGSGAGAVNPIVTNRLETDAEFANRVRKAEIQNRIAKDANRKVVEGYSQIEKERQQRLALVYQEESKRAAGDYVKSAGNFWKTIVEQGEAMANVAAFRRGRAQEFEDRREAEIAALGKSGAEIMKRDREKNLAGLNRGMEAAQMAQAIPDELMQRGLKAGIRNRLMSPQERRAERAQMQREEKATRKEIDAQIKREERENGKKLNAEDKATRRAELRKVLATGNSKAVIADENIDKIVSKIGELLTK